MKLIEKKIAPSNKSFTVYRSTTPCLDESWHFHHEYELIYIEEGHGLRFIGDDISEFKGGELALIGSGLPHLWRNSPEYYENHGLKSDIVVVQFDRNFLGDQFFEIHEMIQLKTLLDRSLLGLDFNNKQLNFEIGKELVKLTELSSFGSIKSLLGILEKLSTTVEAKQIASSSFIVSSNNTQSERINNIYQYVLDNFRKQITLTEIAEVANMGISPFCRFFKKRTHKSFSEFLNEVRVGHACKLLIDHKQSIEQIAYASGFNSQTNFNRQFKKIKKRSPVEFRRHFMSQ